MFKNSKFDGDMSDWKPLKLDAINAFNESNIKMPYWGNYENKEEREKSINSYHLNKKLTLILPINNNNKKRLKI